MRLRWLTAASALLALSAAASAPAQYLVPRADVQSTRGVDFAGAHTIAPELTTLFQACDVQTTPGGCADDPAHNTVILKFTDGTVFFDAKMAIDADGSQLSKKHEFPNQPETAFRYPDSMLSLDSEHVPYIVIPMGDFRRESGVMLGDLAVVVKGDQVHYAIVGDVGPRTHIGEGSMFLHNEFGRSICRSFEEGHCSDFLDTSMNPPVLYFLFPDTRKLIVDGLSPDNINTRIATAGKQVWTAFRASQAALKE